MHVNSSDRTDAAIADLPLYIRADDVTQRYGCSRSWFFSLVADGLLPQPRRFGSRMSVWDRAALDAAFNDPQLPQKISDRVKERRSRSVAPSVGRAA